MVFVEAVEDGAGDGEGVLVTAGHRQSAEHHVESRRLGGVEAFVVEVGLVDDRGDPPQDGVVEVVASQQGLERAVVAAVAELDTADVEGDGTLEIVVSLKDEGMLVFTVPGSAPNCLPWPTGRANYLRTGYVR